MRKCIRLAVPVFLLALAVPATAAAQIGVFGGAGATIPSGDFGDVADTGWQVYGGLLLPVGEAGMWVAAHGFYGQNSYSDVEDESVKPFGAMGLVGYNFNPGAPGPFVFGGAGIVGADTDVGEIDTQFGYQAGLGYDLLMTESYGISVYGAYIGSDDIQFFSIGAGIGFTLGGGGM